MSKPALPPSGKLTNVYTSKKFTDDMRHWCDDNCKGFVYSGNNWDAKFNDPCKYIVQFVFPEDATAFALKWL